MPKQRFDSLKDYVDAHPRGVTQGAIAHRLGLTDSQLSAYLRGSKRPSPAVAVKLEKQTGVPLASLLGVA